MCLSTPQIPQDNSAQIAQAQADQRQSQISQGQQAIDTAFQPFNDDYFNKYQQSYEDAYNPQVDQQYQTAQRKQVYGDYRRGVQNSTPAIYDADQLNNSYANQRQQVATNAASAADTLKQ